MTVDVAPTDGLRTLAIASRAARIAAAALRWAGACACAFAGLLIVAVGLATVERPAADVSAEASAAAYLDFDLSVLRVAAQRGISGDEQARLLALWSQRPDWQLRDDGSGGIRLASVSDAWTAATSDKSRFRTAARGALDALPLVIGALALALAAGAIGGALAGLRQGGERARLAFAAATYALVAHPLWTMLDPEVFYDRTRSPGTGLAGAIFVAAFAGILSGTATRALFGPVSFARLGGGRALAAAARAAALDSADWLIAAVPALAGAALFVCAKADQDPRLHSAYSGLGALIRAALGEASAGERLSSCALVGGAALVLWFAGHRFVIEARGALGARRYAP